MFLLQLANWRESCSQTRKPPRPAGAAQPYCLCARPSMYAFHNDNTLCLRAKFPFMSSIYAALSFQALCKGNGPRSWSQRHARSSAAAAATAPTLEPASTPTPPSARPASGQGAQKGRRIVAPFKNEKWSAKAQQLWLGDQEYCLEGHVCTSTERPAVEARNLGHNTPGVRANHGRNQQVVKCSISGCGW